MTRVLFVHGLESGPGGRKARNLVEAGFEVVAREMPCGRDRALRDPLVIGIVVVAIGLAALNAATIGVPGVFGTLALVLALAPLAPAFLMRRMLRRSVDVQRRALAEHPIDAVVASSFGGAVAVELLRTGAWTGPTVLLCPAHGLVAERARRPVPTLPDLPRILVVHGRGDEVVPLAHSEALVAGTRARLAVVDDDHRLSATATPANLAAWVAEVTG